MRSSWTPDWTWTTFSSPSVIRQGGWNAKLSIKNRAYLFCISVVRGSDPRIPLPLCKLSRQHGVWTKQDLINAARLRVMRESGRTTSCVWLLATSRSESLFAKQSQVSMHILYRSQPWARDHLFPILDVWATPRASLFWVQGDWAAYLDLMPTSSLCLHLVYFKPSS